MKISLHDMSIYIPDSEGVPDFSMLSESTLSLVRSAFEAGNFELIESFPIALSPDWDGLLNRLITSDRQS